MLPPAGSLERRRWLPRINRSNRRAAWQEPETRSRNARQPLDPQTGVVDVEASRLIRRPRRRICKHYCKDSGHASYRFVCEAAEGVRESSRPATVGTWTLPIPALELCVDSRTSLQLTASEPRKRGRKRKEKKMEDCIKPYMTHRR